MRCDKCIFWDLTYEFTIDSSKSKRNHVDDYEGVCRRYPPQLDSVYAGKLEDEGNGGCESCTTAWYQPLTSASTWCGEFKEKSNEP